MTDFLKGLLEPYRAAMSGTPQPLPSFGTTAQPTDVAMPPTGAMQAGGSLSDWVRAAMGVTGVGLDWYQGLLKLAQYESGGSPTAYNETPVASGQHAQGLFQTIPSTFQQYALQGYGPISNPIANAIAAIRYIQSRYGSVYNTPLFTEGGGGY
jgi:hypothetical protein